MCKVSGLASYSNHFSFLILCQGHQDAVDELSWLSNTQNQLFSSIFPLEKM
jgi:hypothetical protein